MATCNAVLTPSGVLVGSGGYYFAIALLAITPAFMLATCAAFLYFQKSSMLLRKREFFTLVMTCFQITSLLCYTAIYDVVGAGQFPCILLVITFNLFAALQAFNLLFKVNMYLNYTASVQIGKEVAAENAISEHSRPTSTRSSTATMFRPTYIPPKSSWRTFKAFCKSILTKDKSKLTLDEKIRALQFMKTPTYHIILGPPVLTAAAVTMGVRIALDSDMRNNCSGCRVSMYEAIVQLVLTAWGMVISYMIFSSDTLANDTLRLAAEVKETLGFPLVVPWLLGLILYVADWDGVNHTFNWLTLCLLCNMSMLYHHVWKLIYLSWRLRRDMFKSKRDLPACFLEVYADPELKKALCALLDSEMSSEVYWFYDSVKFYKRTYDGASDRSKELARFTTEHYVLPSAPFEINISGATREKCSQQFHQNLITEGMFDAAVEEVMRGFYTDAFLRFLVKMEQRKLPDFKVKTVSHVSTYGNVTE